MYCKIAFDRTEGVHVEEVDPVVSSDNITLHFLREKKTCQIHFWLRYNEFQKFGYTSPQWNYERFLEKLVEISHNNAHSRADFTKS